MKLFTIATPSHDPLIREFLLPSAHEFDIQLIRGEQRGSGVYEADDWINSIRQKIEAMTRATLEPEGSVVLWCDADVQFFGPCAQRLEELLADNDLIAQNDFGRICAGFFAFRCNDKTRALMRTISEDKRLCSGFDDQESMNKHRNLVRWGLLPKDEFWTISHSTRTVWKGSQKELQSAVIPQDIRMHHANCCVGMNNKIRLLFHVRDVVRQRTGMTESFGIAPKDIIANRKRLAILGAWKTEQ